MLLTLVESVLRASLADEKRQKINALNQVEPKRQVPLVSQPEQFTHSEYQAVCLVNDVTTR